MINRYFDISAAQKDLKYEPIINFEEGWASTIEWYKNNWLPRYLESKIPKVVVAVTEDKKEE